MNKKGLVISGFLVIILIGGYTLAHQKSKNSSHSAAQSVDKNDHSSLYSDQVKVIKANQNDLVEGFPPKLLLIKGAVIQTSEKKSNGSGMTTYQATFTTDQSIKDVTKVYSDYLINKKNVVKYFHEDGSQASFVVRSLTSQISYSAKLGRTGKGTEYHLEVYVQE